MRLKVCHWSLLSLLLSLAHRLLQAVESRSDTSATIATAVDNFASSSLTALPIPCQGELQIALRSPGLLRLLSAPEPGSAGGSFVENYDILMIVVLVAATLFGAIKGFAWQLASIASIAVSYFVAYRFREPFSESIKADPPWNRFLAMLILYVGTSLVIWVFFRMVSKSIDRMKLKDFDRQIGAAFGLAKGALFCVLITMFTVTLVGPELREKIVNSRSGYYIAKVLDKSDAVMPPELHEVVAPYIERFEQRMHNAGGESRDEGGLKLPWPIPGQNNRQQPEAELWNPQQWNPQQWNPQGWIPQSASGQNAPGQSGLPPMR